MSRPRHLALVGPTASGKSALALAVARARPDVEIVSVDSMQVYRGMDIGTAKPTAAERAEVRHHLLDLADPGEAFSVARFQAAARATIEDIEDRGHRALLVGGTGLYYQAVVDGLTLPAEDLGLRGDLEARAAGDGLPGLYEELIRLDPVAAGRIDPGNRRRVVRALEVTLATGRPFSSYGPGVFATAGAGAGPSTVRVAAAGVWLPRAVTARRIAERVEAMVAAGLVDEVRRLDAAGLSATARQAIGYQEILEHLEGRRSLDDAVARAADRTRALARRQRMWFRRDRRVAWFGAPGNPLAVLPALLATWDQPGTE